jgi:hypothetical protein
VSHSIANAKRQRKKFGNGNVGGDFGVNGRPKNK